MRLLVVDWDYFFPTKERDPKEWALYDWGHAEQPLFIDTLWPFRAAAFVRNGLDLPKMDERWKSFWKRFAFSKHAQLFYADSNAWAGTPRVKKSIKSVDLFDAHHDSGYNTTMKDWLKRENFSCEDWMLVYHLALCDESKLRVRYPDWKTWAFEDEPEPAIKVVRSFDDGRDFAEPFDRVFVCRSGAWVPPWCDNDFFAFVGLAPLERKINLDNVEPREFDLEAVTIMAELERGVLERASGSNI